MKPTLLFMCGRPGTGKTTLAKAFARHNKFLYLDKDDIAEPLCPNDRESDNYKKLHFPIYDALLTIASSNIDLGLNVVIDSPFNQLMQDKEWWQSVEVKFLNANIKVIRTFCDENENLSRLIKRGYERDKSKINDFQGSLETAPMMFKILPAHMNLNTNDAIEQQLKQVLNFIAYNQ